MLHRTIGGNQLASHSSVQSHQEGENAMFFSYNVVRGWNYISLFFMFIFKLFKKPHFHGEQ